MIKASKARKQADRAEKALNSPLSLEQIYTYIDMASCVGIKQVNILVKDSEEEAIIRSLTKSNFMCEPLGKEYDGVNEVHIDW